MLKTYIDLGKIETLKSNSLKGIFYTTELSPEAKAELFTLQSSGQVAAVFQGVENDDRIVEALEVPKEGKSDSERLRATLWRVWEAEGKKGNFELFRSIEMDKIITHYKSKLPPKP